MVKAHVREVLPPPAADAGVDLQAGADLPAAMNEGLIDDIQTACKRAARRVFELTWQGSRTPRGTVIIGKEIGFTQHGIVADPSGKHIGTYERLQDGAGPTSDRHRMIVYLHPERDEGMVN